MCMPTVVVGPTCTVGFLRPSTDTMPTCLRLFRETVPFQSPFTTRMGIRRIYPRLPPPQSPRGRVKFWRDLELSGGGLLLSGRALAGARMMW